MIQGEWNTLILTSIHLADTRTPGFNTFLPPGYRIDCSLDPAEAGLITVTTPNGVVKRDVRELSLQPAAGPPTATTAAAATSSPATGTGAPNNNASVSAAASRAAAVTQPNRPAARPAAATAAPARPPSAQTNNASYAAAARDANTTGARATPPGATTGTASANASPAPQQSAAGIGAGPGPARAQALASSGQISAQQQAHLMRQPAEFNHAINFVNKIKQRFNRRPDIYKSFLEILQKYQKEQKAIQDVYAQVTILFRDAPDLLEEFKEFLPDTSGSTSTEQGGATASTSAQAATASTSAAGQASGAAPAQQPAQPAQTTSRTARTGTTTSLFGVGPGSTSQPQNIPLRGPMPAHSHAPGLGDRVPGIPPYRQTGPGSPQMPMAGTAGQPGSAGYMNGHQIGRDGRRIPNTLPGGASGAPAVSLDAAASRKPVQSGNVPYDRERELAAQNAAMSANAQHSLTYAQQQQEKYADDEWQPPSGRAKKRQNTGQPVSSAVDRVVDRQRVSEAHLLRW